MCRSTRGRTSTTSSWFSASRFPAPARTSRRRSGSVSRCEPSKSSVQCCKYSCNHFFLYVDAIALPQGDFAQSGQQKSRTLHSWTVNFLHIRSSALRFPSRNRFYFPAGDLSNQRIICHDAYCFFSRVWRYRPAYPTLSQTVTSLTRNLDRREANNNSDVSRLAVPQTTINK